MIHHLSLALVRSLYKNYPDNISQEPVVSVLSQESFAGHFSWPVLDECRQTTFNFELLSLFSTAQAKQSQIWCAIHFG